MKRLTRLTVVALLATLVAGIIGGCATVSTKREGATVIATSEAFSLFSGEYENTEYFKEHPPRTIAVAPFADLERKFYSIDFDEENPAEIVRRGMYNHISSLPYRDTEIVDVDTRLLNAGFKDVRTIIEQLGTDPEKLKSILGTDALVTGEVTHYDRYFAGIYSQVAIGCEVKMWDLESGKLLWRGKHVQRAHAGGVSISPIGLLMSAVAAVWNLRESEMLSQTDDLFREIASTIYIPEGLQKNTAPTPMLNLFTVLNAGEPFRTGEKVAFRIVGDKNCQAYADLIGYKSNIEMQPVSAAVKAALESEIVRKMEEDYKKTGHELTNEMIEAVRKEYATREVYEGYYMVEPGEEAYGLMAKGYLVNEAGGMGQALDAVNMVDIDGLAPDAPVGLTVSALDGSILLAWDPINKNDVTMYEVWSSDQALSGFSKVAEVQTNQAVLEGDNFVPQHIKVRAIDKAENTGAFTPVQKGVPLPEYDLYELPQPGPALSGVISGRALLTADKNPYTVGTSLKVGPKGMLYAEPGVVIQFASGASLTVEGGLLLFGTPMNSVQLIPEQENALPGSWDGIILNGATAVKLRSTRITGAMTGVAIRNCAANIVGSTIEYSAQAGLHIMDNAKPVVSCSYIVSNEGQGAIVIEGEGVSPSIKDCVLTDNEPFQVQSFTPLAVDLSGNFWGMEGPDMNQFLGDIRIEPALKEPAASCVAN